MFHALPNHERALVLKHIAHQASAPMPRSVGTTHRMVHQSSSSSLASHISMPTLVFTTHLAALVMTHSTHYPALNGSGGAACAGHDHMYAPD